MKKLKTKKQYKIDPFTIKFRKSDLNNIRRLLFLGIILKIRQKKKYVFKVWISGFSYHYTKARTPVSAYRKMFKYIKNLGIDPFP